ncbi:GlsB/YeaQ/YmgE family stress response membrane protein [Nonomuraea africana]|uniref:Membrane protein YeaQ/YmgE (Transglycosylase-associated protein family) n=1 Tax=Nonomuraea africana TaxID=46171 RepID=A0ABR9KTA3_9ACTN|nr:GlsB/YeaQ/YmgE family stress response membrane protein [Nonomuraea africana]MBE1565261.1 putative membrane protein YeaQ/YmgE (transglycosylase-associated protein family) [Nonomuraea africana]
MIGSIISAIVFGIIIGAIARLIVPGKQNMSLAMTWVVGVVGSLLGTLVAYLLGVSDTPGINWIQHVLQILFAVVGVFILARAQMSKGTR